MACTASPPTHATGHSRSSATWSLLVEGGPSYSSGSTAPSASIAPGPNTRKASEASGMHL